MNNQWTAFETKEEFKAWRKCNPQHYHLLDCIIFAWRGSTAKVKGRPGHWAAYTREEWMQKSKLSQDQVKRGFAALVEGGLIVQERHRFKGSSNIVWRHPTALAIQFMSNRKETDLARIPAAFAPPFAPPHAPPLAPPLAPPPAPADYTSFPYSSTKSTKPTSQLAVSPSSEEGKGKAGGDENSKPKGKLIILKNHQKVSPKPMVQQIAQAPAEQPATIDLDEDAAFEAILAKKGDEKRAKLLVQFPVIEGLHQSKVKHPGDKVGWDTFAGYSTMAQANIYAKYVEYVQNWSKGKTGSKVMQQAQLDDFDLDLDSIPDYEEAMHG